MLNHPLDQNLTNKILSKINHSYEIENEGRIEKAAASYLDSWNMLPEPRNRWDFSLAVARSLVLFFYRHEQYEDAKNWLVQAFQCFVPEIDTSMDILAGKVYYDSGDIETARKHLTKAYAKGKRRAFSEQDPKYLAFVLAKR